MLTRAFGSGCGCPAQGQPMGNDHWTPRGLTRDRAGPRIALDKIVQCTLSDCTMASSVTEVELTWDNTGSITVARVSGRLDITRADTFEQALIEHVEQNPEHLVINLGGVSYMSSSGIRALLSIYRAAGAKDLRIALCEASPVVKKVLDVVEIGQVLRVFNTEAEATASLHAEA